MQELTNAERETILTMTADDRTQWIVFRDDPVLQRKLEKIGATLTEDRNGSRFYTLPANQVTLRAPVKAREYTEEERAAIGVRLSKKP